MKITEKDVKALAKKVSKDELRCSFCDKHRREVKALICGPPGLYICDECVGLCREILEANGYVSVSVPRPPGAAS